MKTRKGLTRREFVKHSLAAVGAGLAAPALVHAQPLTIEVWNWIDPSLPNARSRMLKKNLERFQELNPNIKVRFVRIGAAEMDHRLPQGAAAGTTPDAIHLYIGLPIHVKAEVLEPLDRLAQKMDKSDWVLPWESTVFDGKKMALPYDHRVYGTYYRKDILDRMGLKPPKRWDDLCKAAPKLIAANIIPFTMGFSKVDNADILFEFFNEVMFQVGADFVDAKGLAAFGNDKGLRFFQLISDLTKCKAFPPEAPEITADFARESVVTGRAAMMMLSHHQFAVARASGPGENLQWAPAPSFTGDIPPSAVIGSYLGIGKYSKNKEAAWKYLEYMTSNEAQVNQAMGGEMPTRKSTFRDPWFSTPEARLIKGFSDFTVKQGVVRQFPASLLVLCEILAEGCQMMFLKGTPPRETMNNVVTQFNSAVSKG
jgi:multiple sugar transport system substrate-binding protein